jgi:NAD(P)-dependent dehydrogenase (short-subunit alcohol dehydrogenase family)
VSVVVVTGGGAGIGAAIAEEVGRQGAFVVTMDPLVSLDGSEQLPAPEETTAGRIVAAGGQARASNVSVTDADAVCALFDGLVDEFGAVDGVINVAGISRPTSFTGGSDDDWRSVLDVHLNGYRNILEAALPVMADARHGRILGVTSGSGWRFGDAGAYGCAKRAVASLTWQLGWQTPPGVSINAMSPIAVTRMVTAALERVQAAGGAKSAAAAGPLLGTMPQPEELGPVGAYLVSDAFAWCTGEVVFAGGPEVAVVEQPRLLEMVRTDDVRSLAHAFETVGGAWAAAEKSQLSGGGSNPRFPDAFGDAVGDLPGGVATTCAVVSDRRDVAAAVTAAFEARKVACTTVAAPDALAAGGPFDAVVVALAGTPRAEAKTEWERTLIEHEGIVDAIDTDARWARAVADHAASTDRPVRLVTLSDATTSGGRSRAQAAAQHSRPSRKSTGDRVAAFAVSVESADARSVGEFAAYLACSPDAVGLSGAELVAGDGWVGLRSHPRPSASLVFGGGALPDWFDSALRGMVR